jgi:hypothetical protein
MPRPIDRIDSEWQTQTYSSSGLDVFVGTVRDALDVQSGTAASFALEHGLLTGVG